MATGPLQRDELDQLRRNNWIAFGALALTTIGGIAVMFWSLTDPRGEIKDIRTSYLTIREHTEFTQRIDRDIRRLEEENRQQSKDFVRKSEFDSIVNERNQRIGNAERSFVTKGELQAHLDRDRELESFMQKRIDDLQRQVDRLLDVKRSTTSGAATDR